MSLDINDKLYVEANALFKTPNLACNDVIAKEDNNQQQERISKMPRLVCRKENIGMSNLRNSITNTNTNPRSLDNQEHYLCGEIISNQTHCLSLPEKNTLFWIPLLSCTFEKVPFSW